MVRFNVVLFLVLLVGCTPYRTPEEKAFYQEYSQLQTSISQQCGVQVAGSGVGWSDKVDRLILYLHYPNAVSLDEARLIFMRIVEKVTFEVNHRPAFQALIKRYPVTLDELEIVLTFPCGSQEVDRVTVLNRQIIYDRFDPQKKRYIEVLRAHH